MESVCTGNRTEGSNPSLSANNGFLVSRVTDRSDEEVVGPDERPALLQVRPNLGIMPGRISR